MVGEEFDRGLVEQAVRGTPFRDAITHLQTTSSTNELALEAAAGGARTGAWIADEQTAGRGRGGHDWHSARGEGLYLSALVTPGVAISEAPQIPLATGLAAQAAIREVTGLEVDIRWPNDLMAGERKLGGILVESVSEPSGGGLRFAVIGVGINVGHAAFPPELQKLATSIRIETGREFRREPLAAALLLHLTRELRELEQDSAGVRARFTSASSWVSGKYVKVEENGGYTGWTCGLNAQGFLQVRDSRGGLQTVYSGGVRPAGER